MNIVQPTFGMAVKVSEKKPPLARLRGFDPLSVFTQRPSERDVWVSGPNRRLAWVMTDAARARPGSPFVFNMDQISKRFRDDAVSPGIFRRVFKRNR